jgi:hypothetical protein
MHQIKIVMTSIINVARKMRRKLNQLEGFIKYFMISSGGAYGKSINFEIPNISLRNLF